MILNSNGMDVKQFIWQNRAPWQVCGTKWATMWQRACCAGGGRGENHGYISESGLLEQRIHLDLFLEVGYMVRLKFWG